jgi:uncharacterized protein (TIGR03000 family)
MYTAVLMAALTTGSASPDFFRHHCGGCGCYGGYGCSCGYGWCGCYGGCYGGYGYRGVNYCGACGCFACYGCYGWYGCNYYCSGYCGGFWCNCYCCWSCYGPATSMPVVPGGESIPDPKKVNPKNDEEVSRAKVIIEVPEDAKLYIDGQLMKSTSARRVFATPTLTPGSTYYYDIKAVVVRDGKSIADTQRVHLRPGQTVQASFGDMATPVATAQRRAE